MAPVPNIEHAHLHARRHRAEIEASDLCGCFYCLRTFAPEEIARWLAVEQTALCPHCGIDSVIGSASGFPLTAEFLQRMHTRWFAI